MQKKLIALAIAGLSSVAFADTANVTVYGVADATYDNVAATGATTAATATVGQNYEGRGRVSFNSSYFGFKGVESIGNGLAVAFQLESSFTGNSGGGSFGSVGTTSGTIGARDTYVGLAGGFGTIAFGNLTGPTRALGAAMDPNSGATGIGANSALLAKLGGGSGAGVYDQRIANAIAYISPNLSGATIVVGYLPNINRGLDTTTQTNSANLSAWTAGVTYTNGPIFAGIAYTTVKDSNASSSASSFSYRNNTLDTIANPVPLQNTNDMRLAGKYDFGAGTIGLMYDAMKATTATALNDAKQTVIYVPVTFTVGSGKIIGQYGTAGKVKLNGSDVDKTAAKHIMVGYEYNLSKRTTVKALYSAITNEESASYDFLYGVSNPNSTAYAGGVKLGSDPKGFSVGLRHTF